MTRNEKDFTVSLLTGGAATLIILSKLHEGLSMGEIITFWVACHMVCTAAVWWLKEKCRDAWGSIHGKR